MLIRYWQWTSAPAPVVPAVTSVSFGPLRFRQWTNGNDIPPEPPIYQGAHGETFRIDMSKYWLIRRDDEEIMDLLASLLAAGALH